jgi:hypothetical protein
MRRLSYKDKNNNKATTDVEVRNKVQLEIKTTKPLTRHDSR